MIPSTYSLADVRDGWFRYEADVRGIAAFQSPGHVRLFRVFEELGYGECAAEELLWRCERALYSGGSLSPKDTVRMEQAADDAAGAIARVQHLREMWGLPDGPVGDEANGPWLEKFTNLSASDIAFYTALFAGNRRPSDSRRRPS